MSGTWVAALDGGGTKTALALASRAGEVLLLPEAAGCNPQDGPGWDAVLSAALARAAQAEGGLAAAVLGIPGRGEVPAHDTAVDALLARLLPVHFEAMNDVALAHLGAFGGGAGVLLLAGTGSMAWARGPAGEARVGGWGDAFGDEGSAHWIGREALALASRIMDGREPKHPAFASALCEALGAAGPFGPLAWLMAQGAPRAAVAGVAQVVDAIASRPHGDETVHARKLLGHAGKQLGILAITAARRAGLDHPLAWVAAGSVFRSARVSREVERLFGPSSSPRLTTLGGGLKRAATRAGWAPDEAWATRVDARLRGLASTR